MKTRVLKTLLAASATLALSVLGLRAQTGAEVIANDSVSLASLDKGALRDLFLGKTGYWPGGQAVVIVVLTEKTDAALQDVSGMSASQFKTHWQRLTFSGRGKQPKEVDATEKLVALVGATKGAVAMVPSGTALAGVKKIDIKP